ncbi:glutathione S-transferase N-terminal domain-containing protein [Bartonella sp. LJL80]
MRLLGSATSPFVAKARLAAYYLNIDLEEIAVDTFHDPEELTKFNPLGKIPALITDDGDVFFDSPVILSYLDYLGGNKLFPQDPLARIKVERLEAAADGLCDVLVAHVYERRYRPEALVHQPWLDKQWGKATRMLDYFEENVPQLDKLDAGNLTLAIVLNFAELRFAGLWDEKRPQLKNWRDLFILKYADLQALLP